MKTTQPGTQVGRLTIPEACATLRLSRPTMYKRSREGKLKLQRDGGRTYVSVAELARYIAALDAE